MASTPEERGKALVDLLLLADALPHGGRAGKPLEFPPLNVRPSVNDRPKSQVLAASRPLPDKVIAIQRSLRARRSPTRSAGRLPSPTTRSRGRRSTSTSTYSSHRSAGKTWSRALDTRSASTPSGLDSATLVRSGQCRLWWGQNPVDLFFSNVPHPRGDAEAGADDCHSPARPSPSWRPEHLAVFKAMFDRTEGLDRHRADAAATDGLDVGEVESWLERNGGRGRPSPEAPGRAETRLGLDHVVGVRLLLRPGLAVVAEGPVALGDRRGHALAARPAR